MVTSKYMFLWILLLHDHIYIYIYIYSLYVIKIWVIASDWIANIVESLYIKLAVI